MKQLIHNGVMFVKYEPMGFSISVKGRRIRLTPEQEEMAVAWVKKLKTDYVNDRRFVRNFFNDFCEALGLDSAEPEEFDFSEIKRYIDGERARKLALSKEEKKLLAAVRKEVRMANKEKCGYAIVDGKRVEVSNYTVEPSSIFMGRGKHPLRGRWKRGAKINDVILNLSHDAQIPDGDWGRVVWQPDSMWIAKWKDKLTGKTKYVWLSATFSGQQEREIEKFDQANALEGRIDDVRAHIWDNLSSEDIGRRKLATVCYLIDELKLRVGDEKDRDEADTVGATTLRPKHIRIGSNGRVAFRFLGKDAVPWKKEVELPSVVVKNLKEFIRSSESCVFEGVRSRNVNGFLGEVVPGLTAKVFRTYHASKVVRNYLENVQISELDPEFVKKHMATMANLEAAVVCNHKRKLPKRWRASLAKKRERLKSLKARAKAKRTRKSAERIAKLRLKIKAMKATRDYNLRTSLKSYIDPRIYYSWGRKVDFDWKKYYPKALRRKFSWVENSEHCS